MDERVNKIKGLLGKLPKSEAYIIEQAYLAKNTKSIRQISKELDISHQWGYNLRQQAIEKIQKLLGE